MGGGFEDVFDLMKLRPRYGLSARDFFINVVGQGEHTA